MKSFLAYISKTPTIYTLIWCLYFLQGTLYPEESIIAKLLLVAFFFLSLKYAYKVIAIKTNGFIQSLFVLAIMFGLYGVFRILSGTDASWLSINDPTTYFKEYELSILPIFAFYYFARTNKIDEKWFLNTIFIFLGLSIIMFYREQMTRLEDSLIDEVTNNTGYKFMALLPCVIFLRRKPLIQFTYLAIIVVFILISMKRGAIIVSLVSLLLLLPYMLRSVQGKQRLLVFLLVGFVIVAGYFFVQYLLINNEYFLFRIEQTVEGNASNREDMYPLYYNFIVCQGDIINTLFGNGADSTLRYFGNFAHNDWLEILMNNGLIGAFLYMIYWVNSVQFALKKRNKIPADLTYIIYITLFAYFMKAMFSMSINDMPLFTTSVLGYAVAKKDMILKSL